MANQLKTIGSLALAFLVLGGISAEAAEGTRAELVNRKVLRVCADPANVPFSSDDPEKPGFENKIAEIVADELGGIPVNYFWFPQATGFIRRTLFAKACDVVIGYPQGADMVLNTNPYYRTAYSIVYKKGSDLEGVDHLRDERLQGKKIGIVAGTPPATYLGRAGLMSNAKPYQLFTDRRFNSPMEDMIKDIRSGEIAAGIMWGPEAGYFSANGGEELAVSLLLKEGRRPPMSFRITMAVRKSDTEWKHRLNEIIEKRQADIDKVLLDFNVPIIDENNKQITAARTPGG